jgi:hypothetical protein
LHSARTSNVLRASEIDEVELADLEEILAARARGLLDVKGDGEDGVRATVRRGGRSVGMLGERLRSEMQKR